MARGAHTRTSAATGPPGRAPPGVVREPLVNPPAPAPPGRGSRGPRPPAAPPPGPPRNQGARGNPGRPAPPPGRGPRRAGLSPRELGGDPLGHPPPRGPVGEGHPARLPPRFAPPADPRHAVLQCCL